MTKSLKDYYSIPMDEGPVFTFQVEGVAEHNGTSRQREREAKEKPVKEARASNVKAKYWAKGTDGYDGLPAKYKPLWLKKVFRGTF